MLIRLSLATLALGLGSIGMAQVVKVGNKEIQVHGFFQQGFIVGSGNNFLTMKTKDGSFAITDGGVNISSRLTPRLRVSAQAFSRNVGEMGRGRVMLDYAFADYKFTEWFGVRAGKVKTTLGLFTETQDMEFVHTWALLPQSVYPTDLRATSIAHTGGDLYGQVGIRKAGRINYVAYAGLRPYDDRAGYRKGLLDTGINIRDFAGATYGFDTRWFTPVNGLLVGYSLARNTARIRADFARPGVPVTPEPAFRYDVDRQVLWTAYADYTLGKFRTYGEFNRNNIDGRSLSFGAPNVSIIRNEGWYIAASYRINPKWEFGGYYDHFLVDYRSAFSANNGMRGPVVTLRHDINRFWNVKVEGRFIDGHGNFLATRSFYLSTNPGGFVDRTNLLVVRTGFAF